MRSGKSRELALSYFEKMKHAWSMLEACLKNIKCAWTMLEECIKCAGSVLKACLNAVFSTGLILMWKIYSNKIIHYAGCPHDEHLRVVWDRARWQLQPDQSARRLQRHRSNCTKRVLLCTQLDNSARRLQRHHSNCTKRLLLCTQLDNSARRYTAPIKQLYSTKRLVCSEKQLDNSATTAPPPFRKAIAVPS